MNQLSPYSLPCSSLPSTYFHRLRAGTPSGRDAEEAPTQDDSVSLMLLQGSATFELRDPLSSAWPTVQAQIERLLDHRA
jgi:hypothetical protein